MPSKSKLKEPSFAVIVEENDTPSFKSFGARIVCQSKDAKLHYLKRFDSDQYFQIFSIGLISFTQITITFAFAIFFIDFNALGNIWVK